jgi:hypothetical protein
MCSLCVSLPPFVPNVLEVLENRIDSILFCYELDRRPYFVSSESNPPTIFALEPDHIDVIVCNSLDLVMLIPPHNELSKVVVLCSLSKARIMPE